MEKNNKQTDKQIQKLPAFPHHRPNPLHQPPLVHHQQAPSRSLSLEQHLHRRLGVQKTEISTTAKQSTCNEQLHAFKYRDSNAQTWPDTVVILPLFFNGYDISVGPPDASTSCSETPTSPKGTSEIENPPT